MQRQPPDQRVAQRRDRLRAAVRAAGLLGRFGRLVEERRRPPLDHPGEGLGGVVVGRGQVGVEVPHLGVVLDPRPQRVGQPRHALTRVPLGPGVHVGVRRGEPPEPARDVRDPGDQHERDEGRQRVAQQGADGPARHARPASGHRVPAHREQAERGHEPDARPLDAAGQAEQHPGGQPPAAQAQVRPERAPPHLRAEPFEALRGAVAVDQQRAERRGHQQREEDVQEAGPRHARSPARPARPAARRPRRARPSASGGGRPG